MFAMKINFTNQSQLAERCKDWTASKLEAEIADADFYFKKESLFAIPDFESKPGLTPRTAIVDGESLAEYYDYELSETEWFEITRK